MVKQVFVQLPYDDFKRKRGLKIREIQSQKKKEKEKNPLQIDERKGIQKLICFQNLTRRPSDTFAESIPLITPPLSAQERQAPVRRLVTPRPISRFL